MPTKPQKTGGRLSGLKRVEISAQIRGELAAAVGLDERDPKFSELLSAVELTLSLCASMRRMEGAGSRTPAAQAMCAVASPMPQGPWNQCSGSSTRCRARI
jgi:hypothetical protein